jgi:hypothetical protein
VTPAFVGHSNFALEHNLAAAGQQIAKWRVEKRSVIVPLTSFSPARPISATDPMTAIFNLVH